MIKMRCSFCKQNINKGTGKIYVQKTGKVLYFCSSKCEKNMLKLKRKPRTTKWTQEYQDIKKGTKK
ncbi:50S ribosomal protein L24e [Candidatus Woesearchaeota archaeon CG_4_10_14_0_2_um_filter_33_10]|nr:MAG: 50S ribosomal protein L24 [Candidatus Woesearchaeota archaeon CG1_02_33_12]PIN77510.1 MAG: 50S ribosomal protein L24e [Candidatus Woesearchaeota archaeon CG10_big_fil_rev_8_21_14_0_10_33_12]PIU72721.1 MAG: 50S ribosomal protein L24e [Candidatus Woesearchaeota archaeon CG06_land_8_20_14_3_00_33_13]PIZ54115.1 MAG: 50S ribosomal protein L24e [Candidatus Woesearchaeota archaeon CG_4_10_14_0_2_um_filter_33_10]